jgi:hypothetical protein
MMSLGAEEHPIDRVPEPPPGLSLEERMEFYAADLEEAIGAEYGDHDACLARAKLSSPEEEED